MTVKVSRTRGHCSVCDRGKRADVVLVKLRMPPVKLTAKQAAGGWSYYGPGWLGLCLVCAKLVVKEMGGTK